MSGSRRTSSDTTKLPLISVSAGQGLFVLVVAGEGFEPSKLSRRIYSPLPLAARATCRDAHGRIASNERCPESVGTTSPGWNQELAAHGRLVVRHRQQDRQAGGRERPQHRVEGDLD